MAALAPKDAAEAAGMVADAAEARAPFEIVAGGSKRRFGRTERPETVLDLSRLSGVIDYEPAELVVTARAATPLFEIEALLDAHSQMLSFEPPDWRDLLGGGGEPTLGGTIACAMAGPRRVRAGSARDYLLGFAAINGRGENWKAGGKVVKNVTGYDLCKLQTGAFGTLSILTELTLKVMPKPETACTLILHGLDDATAIKRLAEALNTPHEVSGAAHLPAGDRTAIRLEGPKTSVDYRIGQIEGLFGGGDRLEAEQTLAFWREVAAVRPLLAHPAIWRLCPTPSAAPALVQALRTRLPGAEAYYDWGGGLVWLGLDRAEGDTVRAALAAVGGGHATLVSAPEEMRATTPVFAPLPAAHAALHKRVKDGFDPLGLFNPGRMHEGI